MPPLPSLRRFAAGALAAVLPFAGAPARGETLAWRVPEKEWGAWHDPANWALGTPDGAPAGRVPGAGDRLFGEQTFRFDLGGRTGTVGDWSIGSWNARDLFLANGTLEVAGRWPIHGGLIEIGGGATLRFLPGSFFMPGASDARGRTVRILPGGTLDATGADVTLFNAAFEIAPGAVAKLGARTWAHAFRVRVPVANRGRLELPRGFVFEGGSEGGVAFTLAEGSETAIGGDLAGRAGGSAVGVLVEGGRIAIGGDSSWTGASVFVQTNATVEIDVAKGRLADLSSVVWGPGTTLRKTGGGVLGLGASRPARILAAEKGTVVSASGPGFAKLVRRAELRKIEFTVEGDAANRCWFVSWPERFTNLVESVTYTFPHPDAGRGDGLWSVTTALPFFHRRYPPSKDRRPFRVKAEVRARDGFSFATNLVVRFNPNPIGKPFPNEQVAIGMVSYGPGRERHEMVTNDLANLYVRWSAAPQLLPENANNEAMPDFLEQAERLGIRAMTIYQGALSAEDRDRIKQAWGPRYLGNNVGERTGFLYGAPREMKGPMDADLDTAREWFVCRFMHPMQRGLARGAPGQDPFFFTTSGAAFSGYELEGGADYVCNELYAVGCADVVYAQSEARGAARRWGPEWWCGWLAHEWQTFGIPYESDLKYASLEAGMKALWILGTSLMCLESGSSGTQANPHTAGVPEDRRQRGYTYDEDAPRRYRETVRKVHLWQKEHPRAKGTPDTSIALVLGCNDGYIGRPTTPWAQHSNRVEHAEDFCEGLGRKVNVWDGSLPEENWGLARAAVFSACGTPGVSGTPCGQVDVVQVDDQSRLSDLARYRLLVFGGWNTMKRPAARVLRRWMERGGTLVMCAPQLLARNDRNFTDYAVSDLAPVFPGLRFTGFSEADGFFDNGPGSPKGLPVYGHPAAGGRPRKEGVWLGGRCRLVDVADAAGAGDPPLETVVSVAGRPLVVRRRVGRGWFYLMLSRDFPAATQHAGRLWTALVRALADEVPQRVTLVPTDPDPAKDGRRFLFYAAYPDTAYVMNLDCAEPRAATVRLPGGRTESFTLAPLEIRAFPLPPPRKGGP